MRLAIFQAGATARGSSMFAGIRGLLVVIVLASSVGDGALAAPSSTTGRPVARGATLVYEQKVRHALLLAGEDADVVADPALSAVIADPSFRGLESSRQYAVLSIATRVAINLEQYPRARDLSKRATMVNPESPDEWYRLSQLSRLTEDYEGAGTSLIQLAERWPELLDNLEQVHVLQSVYRLDHSSPTKLALLKALFDANWDRNGAGASNLWYELAALQIERSDTSAAAAAMRRVTTPAELVKLRIDRRFDSLVDHESWRFNVENAAEQRVGDLGALAQSKPRSLSIRTDFIDALLTAGRHEEALAQADVALASIATADADAPPFDDMDLEIWVINSRATALRRLGRTDETVAAITKASTMSEGGSSNVSQVLNLGGLYCALARPRDALATVAKVGDNLSGFGRMVLAAVQQCAALQTGDHAGAEKALAYLREHRKDSQIMLVDALVDAGLEDEAARTLIGLLASEGDRPDALEWAQGYRRPPALAGEASGRINRDAVLARKDVREAVAKVGRIEQFGIFSN